MHHPCIIHASCMHHTCVARRSIGPTTHVVAADAATAGTVGGPKPHDLCFTVDVFGIACGCLRPRFPCKLTTLRFSCMAYMHRIHAFMHVCIYAYMHHICIIYASYMHHICIIHAPYMHHICIIYASYMHHICIIYAWHVGP